MLKVQSSHAASPGICLILCQQSLVRLITKTLTLLDWNSPILWWGDGKAPVWDWLHPKVGQQTLYRGRAQFREASSYWRGKEGHSWTIQGNQQEFSLCDGITNNAHILLLNCLNFLKCLQEICITFFINAKVRNNAYVKPRSLETRVSKLQSMNEVSKTYS